MNLGQRPASKNIQDLRSPFGSLSVDPDYWTEDRIAEFLRQSLLFGAGSYSSFGAPQQLSKSAPPKLMELLDAMNLGATSRNYPAGLTLSQPNLYGRK